MISVYSFAMGFLWFNFYLAMVFVLRKSRGYLNRCAYLLVAAILIGALRVLLPLDLPISAVIRSYTLLPSIQSFFNQPLFGTGYTLINCILFVWILGIAVSMAAAITDIVKSYLYRKTIENEPNDQIDRVMQRVVDDNPKLKRCVFIVSDEIDVPQVIGYIRPKLYMPSYNLSDEELRHIILHELAHIRYKDSWIKLFYSMLCVLFWWNPLIHIVRRDIDLLLEVGCDLRVTRKMSKQESLSYLSTATTLMRKADSGFRKIPINAVTFVSPSSKAQINSRFQAVINSRERKDRAYLPLSLLLVVVLALSLLVFVQPASRPSPEELEGALVISPDTSYIQKKDDGRYFLIIDGFEFCEVLESEFGDAPYSSLKIEK